MTDNMGIEQFCTELEQRLGDLMTAFRQVHRQGSEEKGTGLQGFFRDLFALQQWFHQHRQGLAQTAGNQQAQHYELLYKASLVLRASMEGPDLLNLALDTLVEICRCQRGFIASLDGSGNYSFVAARNFQRQDIPEAERDISRSVIERVERLQSEVLLDGQGQEDSLLLQSSMVRREGKALLCVPVVFDGKAQAIIYLDQFSEGLSVGLVGMVRHFSSQLASLLKGSEEFCELRAERTRLLDSLRRQYQFEGIISKSKSMTAVLKTLAKVADTEAPVLIQGETGTGKDLVARAVHVNSRRASGPYIEVDCGALPQNLIESELFGHVRGAFTGAQGDKVGLIEAASGGTLFLDEVNNLPLEAQMRLLRVLQGRKLRRIGETVERTIDFRLISASSRNVKDMAADGSFRSDLFYRLNTVTLDLPPLRERKEDLYLLASSFLEKYGCLYGREQLRLDGEVMIALEGHDWPGNVRELEHIIERGVILSEHSCFTLADLPMELGGREAAVEEEILSLDTYMNRCKKYYIEKVLRESGGNKADAARQLGVNRSYLFQLIKQLSI